MKKNIKFLCLISVLFLGISCKKIGENIIDKTVDVLGSMSATVDGSSWKATVTTAVGNVTNGEVLSVGGVYTSTNGSAIGVSFSPKKEAIKAGTTYTCGAGTATEITMDIVESGKNNYYSTDDTGKKGSGSIKIDTYDSKSISGTFSGKIYTDDGKLMKTITNGKFTAKILI